MFERILVPLDGSDLAESVLVQARRLLARRDAELLLLRVVTLPPSTEDDAGEPLEQLWSRATAYVQGLSDRLAADGLKVRCKVVEGFPAQTILRIATRERATLIMMSTHGRSGIPRWVFGSVTEKVLRGSAVPVLAVPSFVGSGGDAFPLGPKELPFGTIVAPISAGPLSLEILPLLSELAGRFGSKVLLVNVRKELDDPVPTDEIRLAQERLQDGGVSAEPVLEVGDPAARILDVADEKGADLIAMTTHGRSGVPRWLLGSVAEKVLRASNIPLLIVRPAKGPGRVDAQRDRPMPAEFHSDP